MLQDVVLVRPHMRWPTRDPSSFHGPAMNGHAGGLAAGTPVKPGVQPSSAAAAHPQDCNAEDRAAHLANGTANSRNSSDMDSPAAERQPSWAQEQSGFGLFCIFDGHNGRRCAAHMEELICGVRPGCNFCWWWQSSLRHHRRFVWLSRLGSPHTEAQLQGEACCKIPGERTRQQHEPESKLATALPLQRCAAGMHELVRAAGPLPACASARLQGLQRLRGLPRR